MILKAILSISSAGFAVSFINYFYHIHLNSIEIMKGVSPDVYIYHEKLSESSLAVIISFVILCISFCIAIIRRRNSNEIATK